MKHRKRVIDWWSVALLMIGVACGVYAYHIITNHGHNPLILVPSVVCATLGASNLTTWKAWEE